MTDNQIDVEALILAAYASLTRGRAWVYGIGLADLRARVDAPREAVDRALHQMASERRAHVRAEADQKTLTERDHAAAIELGGTARHVLTIETRYGQPVTPHAPVESPDTPDTPEYQPRHARPEPERTPDPTPTREHHPPADQPRHARPESEAHSSELPRPLARSATRGRHRRR
ncbi:hypothetical protein [Nocardia sp. IFM 10818]